MLYITGPLASGLVKRFNHRYVAMGGSAVVCVALLVSTQMPNIPLLRLTYGVLAGKLWPFIITGKLCF